MFPRSYFTGSYFAPTYFPPVVKETPPVTPSGGTSRRWLRPEPDTRDDQERRDDEFLMLFLE